MEDRERQITERNFIDDNSDYYKRSGCGPLLLSLVIIAAFWIIVGIIYLKK